MVYSNSYLKFVRLYLKLPILNQSYVLNHDIQNPYVFLIILHV